MTDWQLIRERREDCHLSAPDETGPSRLLALLASVGLQGREEGGLVFLVPARPEPRKLVALVSAAELFAWDDEQDVRLARRRVSRLRGTTDLFSSKVALWMDACPAFRGPDVYLFVLDLDNWLDILHNQDVARLLEQDVRGVRKFVCGPGELPELLANPFGDPCAAGVTPEHEVTRDDVSPFETPVRDFAGTVTHPFVRTRDPYCWLERLYRHPDASRLTALANRLVRRVMGTDYALLQNEEAVMLHRSGHSRAMPWDCLGYGEQYALAFCAYLALASADRAPGMWLGIANVLGYLDESKLLHVLDLLRDFVVATGASVYVRTNQSDYRRVASHKLELACNCLKELACA